MTKYVFWLVMSMLVALAAPVTPQADSLRLATPGQEAACVEPSQATGETIVIRQGGATAEDAPTVKTGEPRVVAQPVEGGVARGVEAPMAVTPVLETPVSPASANPVAARVSEVATPTIETPANQQETASPKRPVVQQTLVAVPVAQEDAIAPDAASTAPEDEGSLADIIAGMKAPASNDKKLPSKSKTLAIPKNAKKLDFLEGTWRCDRGMAVFDGKTNRKRDDAIYEFTFERSGKATMYVKMKNLKTSYKGPARVRIEKGILEIKHSHLPVYESGMAPSGGFGGGTIHCRQQGKDAMCAVVARENGTKPGNKGEFKFLRIK